MARYERFDVPTQVLFCDTVGAMRGGIAYGDEIICACCGGIFTIEEVYEFASEFGIKVPIIPYGCWVDLENTVFDN